MRTILVFLVSFVIQLPFYAFGVDSKNVSPPQAATKSPLPADDRSSPPAGTPTPNPQPIPVGTRIKTNALVVDAFNPSCGAHKDHFQLGSIVVVKVDKLEELRDQETAKSKKLILFINDIPIKGLVRQSMNLSNNELRFLLTRDNNTKSSWDQLICRPRMQNKAAITVGFDDDYSIPTKVIDANAMTFDIVNPLGFGGWVLFTAALAFLVIYLGRKTPLLRCAGLNSSFSLAYSQMAFWTFFVCSGYVLIYLITLEMPDLNTSMLILMGLSAGTALSGKVIDLNKPVPQTSGNFLNDILRDVDGYTVARLQIFIWTIIMGVIFISNVYSKLAMPEFGVTLLTLMGISSGTYLGFKFPETKALPATVPAPAPLPVPQPPNNQSSQPPAMG